MEQPECRGTVDRLEPQTARVECADGSWADVPLIRMDPGIHEGDRVVRGNDGIWRVDKEATEEARRRVRELLDGLFE